MPSRSDIVFIEKAALTKGNVVQQGQARSSQIKNGHQVRSQRLKYCKEPSPIGKIKRPESVVGATPVVERARVKCGSPPLRKETIARPGWSQAWGNGCGCHLGRHGLARTTRGCKGLRVCVCVFFSNTPFCVCSKRFVPASVACATVPFRNPLAPAMQQRSWRNLEAVSSESSFDSAWRIVKGSVLLQKLAFVLARLCLR